MRLERSKLDLMRDLIGKVNRSFTHQDKTQFYQAAPFKTEEPEVQDPPPQITGTRNQRTNAIPGDKAGNDKISGSMEAGGRSASGF